MGCSSDHEWISALDVLPVDLSLVLRWTAGLSQLCRRYQTFSLEDVGARSRSKCISSYWIFITTVIGC